VAKASVRAAARRQVRRILDGTADPDGRGLLLRGLEFAPRARCDFDPRLIEDLLRLSRLAESLGSSLASHPDPLVRRSAALLGARAHPLCAAFDD
jgi:hypothetical protein